MNTPKIALAMAALLVLTGSLAGCLNNNGSCDTDTGVGCADATTNPPDEETSEPDVTDEDGDTTESDATDPDVTDPDVDVTDPDTSMVDADTSTVDADTSTPPDVTDTDTTEPPPDMVDMDVTPPPGWTIGAHPCVGNRTDALWVDDAETYWVGCGTTAEGTGLYVTFNGGTSWTVLLENWRINDIRRADDGWLYVAGTDVNSKVAVARLDTAVDPFTFEEVWTRGNTISDGFIIGNFARTSDGRAIAESLNGTDIAYRDGDGLAWQYYDSAGWAVNGSDFQMLDLAMVGDEFYAAGSRISQPPQVFLPALEGAAYEFFKVDLSTAFNGEQWGIAVEDATHIYTAGVNQRDHLGVIFRSVGDPYDAANWQMFDVSTLVSGWSWMRGICVNGDRVVAVGEKQPLKSNGGLILLSEDAGATWSLISPATTPNSLTNCHIADDGTITVVGAGGFFGQYR